MRKYYLLLLIVSSCYPLNSVEDIDKYVSYINNRDDTTEKIKEFDTPNSDRKSFGKTVITELHNNQSDVVRQIVKINLKGISAEYKFYFEYNNLVYCEIKESQIDTETTEKIKRIDDVYYFKDGKSIKNISKINKPANENRALLLSKFYFIDTL